MVGVAREHSGIQRSFSHQKPPKQQTHETLQRPQQHWETETLNPKPTHPVEASKSEETNKSPKTPKPLLNPLRPKDRVPDPTPILAPEKLRGGRFRGSAML